MSSCMKRAGLAPERSDRFARNGGAGLEVVRRLRRVLGVSVLAGGVLLAGAALAVAKGPVATSATAVVNPGTGVAPPGSHQLTTILSYLAWGVTATCVAGVLIVASKMALATRGHQGGSEHAGALMWVLVAAVVAGSASALVGALI